MQKEYQLQVLPEEAANLSLLTNKVSNKFKLPSKDIRHIEILRKSVDARKSPVKINLKILIFLNEDFATAEVHHPKYEHVSNKEEVIIIGAGPAGLFAAL